jgi:hypothetical protein
MDPSGENNVAINRESSKRPAAPDTKPISTEAT